MSKYTVVFRPGAEAHLAALFLSAPDRAELTAAADTIDTILRRDPYSYSESRFGTSRVMFVPPLAGLSMPSVNTRITRRPSWCSSAVMPTLTAFHRAGTILIQLSDDGAGFNRQRIVAKARALDLMPEGEKITDQELFNLVFKAGFTTADSTSPAGA